VLRLCCDRAAIVLRILKTPKIFERIMLRLCCDCAAIVLRLCCDCAAIKRLFHNILAATFCCCDFRSKIFGFCEMLFKCCRCHFRGYSTTFFWIEIWSSMEEFDAELKNRVEKSCCDCAAIFFMLRFFYRKFSDSVKCCSNVAAAFPLLFHNIFF
jgi:hypothetical protein